MATVATPSQNGTPNNDLGTSQIDMFDFSSVEIGDVLIPDEVVDAVKTKGQANARAKPAEEVATVATTTEPTSRHPASVVERAKKYNVPAGAIEAMDTPALTELLFSLAESKASETPKTQPTPATSDARSGSNNSPGAGGASAVVTPAPEAFDWGEHAWIDPETGAESKKKYTDEDLNPAIASAIKALHKKIAALEGVVEVAKKGAEAAKARSQDERFDAEFSRFPQLLGTGSGAALAGKPELDRRKAVYDATIRFYKAMPDEMRPAFPLSKAIDLQMKTLFNADPPASVVATVATDTSADDVKKWNQSATQKPSRRAAGDGKTGKAEAVQTVEQWIKENQGEGFGEETSLDEFLG